MLYENEVNTQKDSLKFVGGIESSKFAEHHLFPTPLIRSVNDTEPKTPSTPILNKLQEEMKR